MKKKIHISCDKCDVCQFSLFRHLSKEELRKLGELKICNLYHKGQIIFHEGNRPLGLFALNSGKVKVYKTGTDGREQIVRLAKPGDFIGYRALLGNENYSASACALEDSHVCFIDKVKFDSIVYKNDAFVLKVLQHLCVELREAEDYISGLVHKPVRERLAGLLLMLKGKYGVDVADCKQLNINFSRDDLANMVGTATETLIRHLSEFKEEGLISTKGRKIFILNDAALASVADS